MSGIAQALMQHPNRKEFLGDWAILTLATVACVSLAFVMGR